MFESVATATADLHLLYALTARPRETALPVLGPRQGVAAAAEAARGGLRAGCTGQQGCKNKNAFKVFHGVFL